MKKILLVEDDKFLANLLKLKLSKQGFEIIQAYDGEEAIAKLRSIKPDLILLDIILPKKNGFELMKEINQDSHLPQVPIIVVSNLAQEEDMVRGRKLGAIEYFVKSRTSIDDLVLKIKEICQKKSGLDVSVQTA